MEEEESPDYPDEGSPDMHDKGHYQDSSMDLSMSVHEYRGGGHGEKMDTDKGEDMLQDKDNGVWVSDMAL